MKRHASKWKFNIIEQVDLSALNHCQKDLLREFNGKETQQNDEENDCLNDLLQFI